MSLVIDADSHWTFDFEYDLQRGPLRKYANKLPGESGMLTFFLTDTLYDSLPEEERLSTDVFFPEHTRSDGTISNVPERWEFARQPSDVEDRIEWMDKIGIDFAIVNSGGFPAAFPLLDDVSERQAYCRDCNDLLGDALQGHADRLAPVTYADLTDLDAAIAELTRMRARGSRAFSLRAETVGGLSLGHPHFDRLWSALVDMGMIVSLHVGLAPAMFGDWGHLGLDLTKEEHRGSFMRLANSQRWHTAEVFLSSLLFGGVFERHPNLTVLIAELHAFWLPNYVRRIAGLTHPQNEGVMGKWIGSKSGAEYLTSQVRVSPLPGLGDTNALEVISLVPEMVVFSSDYPHAEGNADPIALYGEGLQQLDPDVREAFLGGSMAKSFERMGDPISTRKKAAAS